MSPSWVPQQTEVVQVEVITFFIHSWLFIFLNIQDLESFSIGTVEKPYKSFEKNRANWKVCSEHTWSLLSGPACGCCSTLHPLVLSHKAYIMICNRWTSQAGASKFIALRPALGQLQISDKQKKTGTYCLVTWRFMPNHYSYIRVMQILHTCMHMINTQW